MCAEIKQLCHLAIPKLTRSAEMCEQYVKGGVPKEACIQPAKDVKEVLMPIIAACHEHLKVCTDSKCIAACQSSLKTAEKAVEKNTACFDACGGAGSDDDCKIVCQDCAQACRACIKSFEAYEHNVCNK